MLKYCLIVSVVAVAFVLLPIRETEAFKTISIHPGAAPAAGADDTAPALDPLALLQGVQSAIAGKLQEIQKLVGSLVQQKVALKQNALNSLQATLGSVKSQVQGLVGQIKPPIVVRKHIYLGGAAPGTTNSDDDDEHATTTAE